ncbi:MAG: hypothetical protein U1F65_09390 [Verrucomicrobiota bacterium]
MNSNRRHFLAAALPLAALALAPRRLLAQGVLTPPGAPAPTGRTLAQIEPRTDISTLAGTATTVYSITVPGSYYLTTNLAGAAGKDTIVVSVAGVTIDLNGFSLQSTDATRAAILGTSAPSLTVRNGRIQAGTYGVRGTTRLACYDLVVESATTSGISGGTDSVAERCRLSACGIGFLDRGRVEQCTVAGAQGIAVDNHALVRFCSVTTGGIACEAYSQILHCTVNSAPAIGISTNDFAIVSHCNVSTSVRSGISVRFNARVDNCGVTAAGTTPTAGDAGFLSGIECNFANCTANQCGVPGFVTTSSTHFSHCLSTTNTGNGFSCSNQCRLVDCTASGNSGLGISTGNRCALTSCIANANSAGGIYATGNGAALDRCMAIGNTGGAGLRVDTGSVRDCEVRETQGGPGIRCSTGSHLLRNTSNANGIAATPQDGFLIEGGRSRVEGNHAYNNLGNGYTVTNTASTNSVLFIGNSAGSNDVAEFSIGANNAAGPILSPAAVDTTTIPTANFNL